MIRRSETKIGAERRRAAFDQLTLSALFQLERCIDYRRKRPARRSSEKGTGLFLIPARRSERSVGVAAFD
jgi:hypothetical protein